MNKKSNKFSPEVKERAVRMVLEHRGEYPSLWAAVESIALKIGCVPQTLLGWVQRHEVDTGARAGVSTRINPLENGILMVRSSATWYWGKIFADAEPQYITIGSQTTIF
jgi:transposase-like protein